VGTAIFTICRAVFQLGMRRVQGYVSTKACHHLHVLCRVFGGGAAASRESCITMAQPASELLRLARNLDPNGFRQLLERPDINHFQKTAAALHNGIDEVANQHLDALLTGQPGSNAARRQLADVAG
jgi:hypothetical protein